MSKIESIIFDMDGTIVDTEPLAGEVIRDYCARWKVGIVPDDANYITGRKWETAIDFLFAKYKFPLPKEEASHVMVEAYREKISKDVQIVPGSVEAVRDFVKEFPVGLVSGSSRVEIFSILDQLGIRKHFQVVLGAEDYPQSKPAPDGFLKAMKDMSWDPRKTVIFEDSEAGIKAGLAAGAWVVAIECTNHLGHDQSKAHHRIRDFSRMTADWIKSRAWK